MLSVKSEFPVNKGENNVTLRLGENVRIAVNPGLHLWARIHEAGLKKIGAKIGVKYFFNESDSMCSALWWLSQS